MDKLTAALGRVDYLLTYSLVTFVGEVVKRYFSSEDIVFIALVVIMLCHDMDAQTLLDSNVLKVTADSAHRVGAVLFVNSVMQTVHAPSLSDTSMFVLVVSFLLATSVVILIPTILKKAVENGNDVASQVSRLVFFMYAENSALLTSDKEVNRVLPAIAMLALVALKTCNECVSPVIQSLMRAFSMLATNVLVTVLVSTPDSASDSTTGVAWLLGLMIMLENLRSMADATADIRDYALWKASSLLVAMLLLTGIPHEGLIVCGVLLGGAAVVLNIATGASCNTLTDLGVLIAANSILDVLKGSMKGTPGKLIWILLLSISNVVHITLATFVHKPPKAAPSVLKKEAKWSQWLRVT